MKFTKRYGYLVLGSLILISIVALSCVFFKKSSQKLRNILVPGTFSIKFWRRDDDPGTGL